MANGFEFENKFNTDSSFTSVKFGYDRPILETELNEMQEIQNYNRKSLMHKICKSGIIELVDRDFEGDKIVYNPNAERNKIAIAPMRVDINGYEIHVCGDYVLDQVKNYLDIDLGDAPDPNANLTLTASLYRNDLVYLQVWFEEITSADSVFRFGNANGEIIDNVLMDARVGAETSHRIGLKWKINIANFVDFDSWEYGFGYNTGNYKDYSPIRTDIRNGINIVNSVDSVFANATHPMFQGCDFFGDNNLWVAGRPDSTNPSNTKSTSLVFAIPLFKITRRNKQMYSLLNPNGSASLNDKEINLRPDNKCFDMIYESDILDLRKNVIINNNDTDYYLDDTLNKLFKGSLSTKSNQKMRRIQFGISPLTASEPNIIFLDSFNQGQSPIKGTAPVITKRSTNTILNYLPSVTQWGLDIDGNSLVTYNITAVNPDEGTIDCFISPIWNGVDDINQMIFSLRNGAFNYPFLTVQKNANQLSIKRYSNSSSNSHISFMDIDISKILSKKIYHLRICWSVMNNTLECYINGKFVGNSLDSAIPSAATMVITQLTLGSIEPLNSSNVLPNNIGFIADEFAIYNKYKGNLEWSLPQDYINGDSLILPSMNGVFRNYRNNQYQQDDMTNQLVTTALTNTFTFNAPYGTMFGSNIPHVYCMVKVPSSPLALNVGDEIFGTWVGLNTSTLIFTMGLFLPTFTKFNGETVAIVYSVMLPGENSIDDVPNEILKSQIYHSDTNITEEVSFNVENNTGLINLPREVPTIISTTTVNNVVSYKGKRYLYDIWDTAYDFSTYRNDSNKDFAFARIVDYNVSGTSLSTYSIESRQYGYDVLYVRNAYWTSYSLARIKQTIPINILFVEKVLSTIDPTITYFNITVDRIVNPGDSIRFELALGGVTFDYNTNSKAFVGNICNAKYLQFTTTGRDFNYIIPCNNVSTLGLCNSGVILSYGTQYTHNFDAIGNEIIDTSYIGDSVCFVNNVQYKYAYLDGIGKPFIKIHLSSIDPQTNIEVMIPAGKTVQIPIFETYQPTSNNILSIWYNYIPYQGILSNKTNSMKRVSKWKYFITSLSSGNVNDKYNNAYSINDLINHLPGGASGGPLITGQDINLQPYNFSTFQNIDGYDLNKNLIFINQTFVGTINDDIDSYFFDLDTDYVIQKQYGNIQDDKIIINNKDFKIYFPMCEQPINKYCGMSCIVMDAFGDLYLFVVGDTNNIVPSVNNSISPQFGDLFIIPYRPCLINRK